MRLIFAVLFTLATFVWPQNLYRFQHTAGEKIRFLGIVNQRVWGMPSLDPRTSILQAATDPRQPWTLLQTVQMLNRIQQETLEVDARGRGKLRGIFQVTQQKIPEGGGGSSIFMLAEEYESEFWRDTQGGYEIESQYYMPVVRNVPYFPVDPIRDWSAPGEEVHDMRRDFSITTPLRVPFTARYKDSGIKSFEGKSYQTFQAEYSFEVSTGFRSSIERSQPIPLTFAGKTVQTIYWDQNLGRQVYYEENYVLALRLTNGNVYRFEGDASAKVVEAPPMDREREAERLRESLRETGDPDITVRPSDRGVTIELPENFIRFPPNSAEILPSERAKLERLGTILKNYPGRDLIIEGHTALAGSESGRLTLSQERAASVGNFFLQRQVRTQEQMTYRGWGATRPNAPNDTEENKARNRRVEITILEN